MKSQADCYRALLDGKTLVSEKYECEVTLNKRGMLEDNKGEGRYFIFCGEYDWKIKEEPKKLYAYKYLLTEGMVCHFTNLIDDNTEGLSIKNYIRCPEYDLEYPCK